MKKKRKLSISPVSVAAVSVVLTGRSDDGDGLDLVEFGRSGADGDQKTEENSENVLIIIVHIHYYKK